MTDLQQRIAGWQKLALDVNSDVHIQMATQLLKDCAAELARLTKELEQSRQGERLLAEVSGKHSDEVIRLTKELKFMQNEAEEWLQKAEANAKDAERLDWMEKNRDDIVVQQRLDVDGGHPWRIYDTRSHRSTVGRSLREAIDFAFQQQPATPTEQETTAGGFKITSDPEVPPGEVRIVEGHTGKVLGSMRFDP